MQKGCDRYGQKGGRAVRKNGKVQQGFKSRKKAARAVREGYNMRYADVVSEGRWVEGHATEERKKRDQNHKVVTQEAKETE